MVCTRPFQARLRQLEARIGGNRRIDLVAALVQAVRLEQRLRDRAVRVVAGAAGHLWLTMVGANKRTNGRASNVPMRVSRSRVDP